ncbi:MAG TPA: tetratricopeptide repeat protein [Candidatus Polarisedimenticolia bacterium]|jgi:tetratricopeptide (TPR) repeat protein
MTPRRRALHSLTAVLISIVVATAAAGKPASPPPSDLHGPLSDFWLRVVRSWHRRIPGLNHGISQTAIWVPIIWDGPDDGTSETFVKALKKREARRWVRASLTMHRWREIAGGDLGKMQALRQNIFILGTPENNELVGRALEATPLRAGGGRIKIGDHVIEGPGLLLIAITPNPIRPREYATIITATSQEALLLAGEVPYGDTDYVVFRGQKVLERGFYKWKDGAPVRDRIARSQSFSQHLTWTSTSSARCVLHYDPAAMPSAEVEQLGRRLDADVERTEAFYGIGAAEVPRLDLYLYASIDEKVSQTSDMRPSHVDPADLSLHAVHGSGSSALSPQLLARVLLLRASSRWGAGGARELPGLAFALSLACRDTFEDIPLAEWAARSSRDPGQLPMDRLFYREPADLESGDLDPLDAASFLRDLIGRAGIEKLSLFYRTATPSDLTARFKESFGLTLAQAERRWLDTVPRGAMTRTTGTRPGRTDTDGTFRAAAGELAPALAAFRARDDVTALKLLSQAPSSAAGRTLLARLHFRAGRFAEAAAVASEVLASDEASQEDRAWARLTLGRARATSGRLVAAIADLRDPDIVAGPEQVRILADYWLEKMGQPLNQRAAHRILTQQANTDLMNWDWDGAEEKMKRVLASDPANREAHALLGQIYLSRYQYFYDYITLFNDLFKGDSDADLYANLRSKGREELRVASSIPSAEPQVWANETGEEILVGQERSDPAMTHFLQAKALILKGELEAAARELTEVLELDPPDRNLAGYCHLYLGRIALRLGDGRTAGTHFKEILLLKPDRRIVVAAREEIKKLDAASAPASRR